MIRSPAITHFTAEVGHTLAGSLRPLRGGWSIMKVPSKGLVFGR